MSKNPKKHRTNPFLKVKLDPKPEKPLILAIGGNDWPSHVDKSTQDALDARGYALITLADIAPTDVSWLEMLILALSMLASVNGVMLTEDWYNGTIAHEVIMAAGHEGVPVFYADEVSRIGKL